MSRPDSSEHASTWHAYRGREQPKQPNAPRPRHRPFPVPTLRALDRGPSSCVYEYELILLVDCEVQGMSSVLVDQVRRRCCVFCAELAGKGPESFSGYRVSEKLDNLSIFSEAFAVWIFPKFPKLSPSGYFLLNEFRLFMYSVYANAQVMRRFFTPFIYIYRWGWGVDGIHYFSSWATYE